MIRKSKQHGPAGGVPTRRVGRPPSRLWPTRICLACHKPYKGRNTKFCGETCRLQYTKEALPPMAELVRPLLGTMSYRCICDEITRATGKAFTNGQIGRIVAKLRAQDNVAEQERLAGLEAERSRANALRRKALQGPPPAPAAPLPRVAHVTQSGANVTLRATSRPVVSEDEVRLGLAVRHGADRGLKLAPEKPKRKRKALAGARAAGKG